MTDNLDDILNEIQQNRAQWGGEVHDPVEQAEAAEKAQAERRDKVASFRLNVDLDDEFGDYTPPVEEPASLTFEELADDLFPRHAAEQVEKLPDPAPVTPQVAAKKPAKKRRRMDQKSREMWGCAGSLFYVLLILGLSLVLACVVIVAALDITGLNKSSMPVKVTIEENSSTSAIAAELKDSGIIRHPWLFELYTKFTKSEGRYESGIYTLTANMGYGSLVDRLVEGVPRVSVRVTIPEGFTVDKIAGVLEENAVCTKKAFYDALQHGDYSSYSFIADIPAAEGKYAGRGYALEGYLFPDTYDFYTGSDGETVVKKLLNNFDNRVDTTYKAKIANSGMTVNEVVILASIVQAEAASGEWSSVARVLRNRLDSPDFPRLQCDATINYFKGLDRAVEGLTIDQNAYDTAVREGLTPGAVGNPGLRAINAAIAPSEEKDVKDCFYFATDYESGITYYSKTHAEHEAICKKYGIGMYASNQTTEE